MCRWNSFLGRGKRESAQKATCLITGADKFYSDAPQTGKVWRAPGLRGSNIRLSKDSKFSPIIQTPGYEAETKPLHDFPFTIHLSNLIERLSPEPVR